MILVDAMYINNSGGKVLLDYLVKQLEDCGINAYYLFDLRCVNNFASIANDRKRYIQPGIYSRYTFYKEHKHDFEKVLCFGNVPPPIQLGSTSVYTYFHNVSLLEQPRSYGLKEKFTKQLKGMVIKLLAKNSNYFIVQSETVKKIVLKHIKADVLVLPFYEENKFYASENKSRNSFAYVSNGNTHKNHKNLLKAWECLFFQGIVPELHLTITENFSDLISEIDMLRLRGIRVFNHGYVNPQVLYDHSMFLIYPSFTESFGLGLVEAQQAGCQIIASDLPYVHEVIVRPTCFDPYDVQSICEKVIETIHNNTIITTDLKISNKIHELIEILR